MFLNKILLFCCLLLCYGLSNSQSLTPFGSQDLRLQESFNGSSSLLLNSEKKWLANILFLESIVTSNTASVKLAGISRGNFLRGNILGTSDTSTGMGKINLHGPSFGYRLNEKWAFSIDTHIKSMSNFWNLDTRMLSEIGEVVKVEQKYPYSMLGKNMKINLAVYSEISSSASYSILNISGHRLTGTFSIKFVNGIANSAIEVSDFSGIIRRVNTYLTTLSDAQGTVSTTTSGNLLSDFTIKNLFKLEKPGIGSDIGFTYTYNGAHSKAYKLRISAFFSDIGFINFKADSNYSKSYKITISRDQGLGFNKQFDNSSFSQTAKVFEKYPEYFPETAHNDHVYRIRLPMTLRLNADYQIFDNFYTEAAVVIGMTPKNRIDKLYALTGTSISPKWIKGNISLAMPLTYYEYAGFNAGIKFRFKNFFIGSNSLITAIVGSRQVDAQVGLILTH